jgi:hypothetical protein
MSTIKLNDLKKTGKELNALLFDDDKPEIDIKASEEDLKEKVLEASELLEEDDEISETAQAVIKALKAEQATPPKKRSKLEKEEVPEEDSDPDPDTEEDDTNEDDLESTIEDCDDITELKDLVKSNDIFKSLRKSLGIQKNIDKLRDSMLDLLSDATEETPEEPPKTKPAAASNKTKAASKEKKEKFSRMEACAEALKNSAPKTIDSWVEKSNEVMVEHGGKENDDESRSQILKIIKFSKVFDLGVKIPSV